jgi:hypothetical protein
VVVFVCCADLKNEVVNIDRMMHCKIEGYVDRYHICEGETPL